MEDKIVLQNATWVLEHQLLQQRSCINKVLEDWRNNDENWREMYKHITNSNARLRAQKRGKQMYIDHITVQIRKIIHESRRMSKKVQTLIEEYYPNGNLGQRLQDFLEEARWQYEQITRFYEANSNILNFWSGYTDLWNVIGFKYIKLLNVRNSVDELKKFFFLGKDYLKQIHFHAFVFLHT